MSLKYVVLVNRHRSQDEGDEELDVIGKSSAGWDIEKSSGTWGLSSIRSSRGLLAEETWWLLHRHHAKPREYSWRL